MQFFRDLILDPSIRHQVNEIAGVKMTNYVSNSP